jgi:predicted site-specific integrase-resolvase
MNAYPELISRAALLEHALLTQRFMGESKADLRLVPEIGSAINDERSKLHALLRKRDFDILLVNHKDRPSRFGFQRFETLCPFRIEVINVAEHHVNDLMEDLVAILTSFAARLYGQRRGRKKAVSAIEVFTKS